MSVQPIGFFDSGIGGTSIWKEVTRLLPNEATIYLADSANAPYGSKAEKDILDLSKKNVDFLLKHSCKLIVVACNTATTNAIKILRQTYNIPFIGIEPAIKPAALQTKSGKIGVLATKGTLSSKLFNTTSASYAKHISIIEQNGDGLVECIENGNLNDDHLKTLLKTYLDPMIKADIDYLVLGCTHYPYLIPAIEKILPKHIQIIDSGYAVAKQTKLRLAELNLLNTVQKNKPKHQFYTTAQLSTLKQFIKVDSNITFSKINL